MLQLRCEACVFVCEVLRRERHYCCGRFREIRRSRLFAMRKAVDVSAEVLTSTLQNITEKKNTKEAKILFLLQKIYVMAEPRGDLMFMAKS